MAANKKRITRPVKPRVSLPLLFDLGEPKPTADLGEPKPTARDVADMVRLGGADALVDAVRRADAAAYQDIRCRSALNEVKGMPFRWTLNPYRGCTHGCHYCYARRYQTQFALGSDDEFASIIFVKTNFVEVLRRELKSPGWRRDYVAVGTATDCYQPIEGQCKLTRRTLEALHEFRNPVGVVTKGPMVVRDKDLLADMTTGAGCTVFVSVPTVDEDVWRELEPGTAHPLQRLRAVRELVDAGVEAGVLMNPIVPGLSSKPALLERTVKSIADHGARFVGCNVMFLEGGTREHFMRWLTEAHPELVRGYERLYVNKYASSGYRERVATTVEELRRKYRLNNRGSSSDEGTRTHAVLPEAAQHLLNWGASRDADLEPRQGSSGAVEPASGSHTVAKSATTGK
jgi:DNA repair photolyase